MLFIEELFLCENIQTKQTKRNFTENRCRFFHSKTSIMKKKRNFQFFFHLDFFAFSQKIVELNLFAD